MWGYNYTYKSEEFLGERWLFQFDNTYQASVIKGQLTYGGSQGLYEVAVMRDNKFVDNPILDQEVEGWMTQAQVQDFLDKVNALPKPSLIKRLTS